MTTIEAHERRIGASLVAPALLLLAAVLLLPQAHALVLSFFEEGRFVGLKHYGAIFASTDRARPIVNTLVFTVASVAVSLLLGFGIAMLLHSRQHARRLVRSLAIAPFVIPPIVGAFAWKMMLDPNFGILNYFLTWVGVPMGRIEWLSDPTLAMATVVLADVWMNTPFVMLVILAGLQNLPRSPFEAAAIDGASAWLILRRVLLPLLAPSILVAVIFRTVFALREFATIWVMTQGGPVNATYVLSMDVYRNLFLYFREGMSAAVGLVMLLLTLVLTLPLMLKLYRVSVARA
ncbi:MAG: sugar ABC transporter permease [Candidatus Rokubacteria bacterium]|nr:sugar ABC transporter permease [Candidatus Rokubacteria bacterium]